VSTQWEQKTHLHLFGHGDNGMLYGPRVLRPDARSVGDSLIDNRMMVIVGSGRGLL
jgi:hypothetical protein